MSEKWTSEDLEVGHFFFKTVGIAAGSQNAKGLQLLQNEFLLQKFNEFQVELRGFFKKRDSVITTFVYLYTDTITNQSQ